MRFLFAFFAVVWAAPLAAQSDGCTMTIHTVKELPDSLTDSLAMYIPANSEITVSVTESADSVCHVTDADAFDESASVEIPGGEYTVLVRSTGTKGGHFTIGDLTAGRAKGKPIWQDATDVLPTSDGSAWELTGGAKSHLQIRLISAIPEPESE